jgi:hypothetical protein
MINSMSTLAISLFFSIACIVIIGGIYYAITSLRSKPTPKSMATFINEHIVRNY